MLRSIVTILSCSLLTLLVIGCAKLDQPPQKSALTFPKGRIAIDAVGLEVGVAQLDTHQSDPFEGFWGKLDQQELSLDTRKLLDQNGLRVAVMSSHAPSGFNQLVGEAKIDPAQLSEFETQLHAKGLLRPRRRMVTHQRISNREGQSHKVTTSSIHPEASWVIKSNESKSVGFGQQVRGVVSITTYPNGDGSVRLVVRPEIHHGQERPRIGAGQNSFLIQSSQIENAIEELKFELNLRSGESLVIAPTQQQFGVGQVLFGNVSSDLETEAALEAEQDKALDNDSQGSRPEPLQRIMMVRVVQTQMDDLFSAANVGEKLTTNPYH